MAGNPAGVPGLDRTCLPPSNRLLAGTSCVSAGTRRNTPVAARRLPSARGEVPGASGGAEASGALPLAEWRGERPGKGWRLACGN